MKKITSLVVSTILMAGVSVSASAFEYDQSKLYAGGGLSINSPDSSGFDSAMGYQFFGGYELSDLVTLGDGIGFSAEVGYMASGDFEASGCSSFLGSNFCSFNANGLWTTAVVDYQVQSGIKVLGRLGLDLGDDDGLMLGGGVSYAVNDKIGVRGEYVIRPNYSSLQANITYSF